ncbi:MAG: KpsF/GutQ family sugar-phosphate isomerase, partial [Bacteroidetes bacterium]|nr:KpsF/GutQ family sugar-phosphate isomerase [Bacteroidota bacterium]
MNASTILSSARRTISLEAESVAGLLPLLDEQFIHIVELLYNGKGRLVVSGIGKSAIIAQKIVATFNSTGTPSLYMHAADAIHGDLGMIQPDDIVMVISRSGNSPEIKVLAPLIRNFGNKLIGMVGNLESYLALQADFVLNTTVSQEACPNNLAPTTSTTAQLVMGDALAVCLMEMRGFSGDDFAKYHPGGLLGKKLYLRVQDLYIQNARPAVRPDTSLKESIIAISGSRLGMTAVVNESNELLGIITDGDLRRMLEKNDRLEGITARDIMTGQPRTVTADTLAVDALDILRKFDITQLVVTNEQQYLGVLHLHDLIREGL